MHAQAGTSDVIVIGGGVIGLSAAYELAKHKVRVRVLEKGTCGKEASWAGAGVLQCGSWHRSDALVHLLRESLRGYEAFAQELKECTGIDPEFVACGGFEVLLEDQQYRMAASEIPAAAKHAQAWLKPMLELLSPEDAVRIEPNLTTELLGVKHNLATCQIRNPRLLAALKAACLRAGVEIVEDCHASGLVLDGSRVSGVKTNRVDYAAPSVVVAAGPWSALVDPALKSNTPVYPVRGQIVLLEMHPRPFTHVIERGKCYMAPRLDGRIVVGATEEHESGFVKQNTAGGISQLLSTAQRLVPALSRASVLQTWSGLRPGTPDRAPFIGPVPGCDGLIAATGHFRSGLILAPITARIVRELALNGTSSFDLSQFAPGRAFRKDHRPEFIDESPCA